MTGTRSHMTVNILTAAYRYDILAVYAAFVVWAVALAIGIRRRSYGPFLRVSA
jgi:hypothetical protein